MCTFCAVPGTPYTQPNPPAALFLPLVFTLNSVQLFPFSLNLEPPTTTSMPPLLSLLFIRKSCTTSHSPYHLPSFPLSDAQHTTTNHSPYHRCACVHALAKLATLLHLSSCKPLCTSFPKHLRLSHVSLHPGPPGPILLHHNAIRCHAPFTWSSNACMQG